MRTQMRELRQGGQLGCCLGKSQQSHRRQTAATGFRPRGASQVILMATKEQGGSRIGYWVLTVILVVIAVYVYFRK